MILEQLLRDILIRRQGEKDREPERQQDRQTRNTYTLLILSSVFLPLYIVQDPNSSNGVTHSGLVPPTSTNISNINLTDLPTGQLDVDNLSN